MGRSCDDVAATKGERLTVILRVYAEEGKVMAATVVLDLIFPALSIAFTSSFFEYAEKGFGGHIKPCKYDSLYEFE